MGYTHYWSGPALDDHQARIAAHDIRLIIKAKRTTIRGPLGAGLPEISALQVLLNGDEGTADDYETFELRFDRGVDDFCKTGRRPYDIVVTACLAYLAAEHGYEVSSDGDAKDWEAGVALAGAALGRPIPNPMIVNQLAGQQA